jgi:lysophospholipase L1-like esterase
MADRIVNRDPSLSALTIRQDIAAGADSNSHAVVIRQKAQGGTGGAILADSENSGVAAAIVRGTGDLLELRDADDNAVLTVDQTGAMTGPNGQLSLWAPSVFDPLRASLDAGESAVMSVLGDSTGNATNEWVYLFADWLADRYPGHTVRHRLWNIGTLKWDTPTQLQTGAGAVRSVEFDGTTNACVSIRDSAITSITGDLDVRVHAAADDWTTGVLAAKFHNVPDRSWRLYVSGSNINFDWTTDGSTLQTAASASLSGLVTNGVPIWLRVTLDVDNGSSQHAIAFYRSTDGATWTQIGSTTTRSGTTSIADTTAALTLGARSLGAAERFNGKIYEAEIRSGIDGTLVAPTLPELWEAQPSTYNGVLSGAPVLDVWNGSGSGYGIADLNSNAAAMYPALGQVATVISCSHNDTGRADAVYWNDVGTLVAHVRDRTPQTGLAFTAQNPRLSPALFVEYHAKRAGMIRGYAQRQGASVLDVYGAFVRSASALAVLVDADGVHPTVAGSQVWRDVVTAAFQGKAL